MKKISCSRERVKARGVKQSKEVKQYFGDNRVLPGLLTNLVIPFLFGDGTVNPIKEEGKDGNM